MKILIALAAGMLATGALAQSTMSTTTTTNSMAPSTMDHHEMKTTMRHSDSHMSGDRGMMMRHRHYRKCYMQMRHGHRVKVCRMRHNMM